MKAAAYRKKIEAQIKFDADYIPSFDTTIRILSEMLEERDRIYKEYQDTGAQPLCKFTTDRGAENMKPNPLLKQWQEINASCLLYLRDLGLTAAGLRKLQGQFTEKPQRTESEIMQEIRKKCGVHVNR